VDLTDDERDLLLRGLFELSIRHVEETDLGTETAALAARLGGNPEAMFFGADRYLGHG